jgi:hypothetical protein
VVMPVIPAPITAMRILSVDDMSILPPASCGS